MNRCLAYISLLLLCWNCNPENEGHNKQKQGPQQSGENYADEEYVMVTTIVNFPMYVNHDQHAFTRWGQHRGVRTSILGPSEWDIQAQIATIEQVIGTRPTGLLINGTDPAIAGAIDRAVEAGIPTVVYDSDVPQSKRHSFLGTNWYDMGTLMGEEIVSLTGGKGKIVYLGIFGLTNMEDGYRGLMDVISDYPDIKLVGRYDDKANTEIAAKLASDILAAHPDLSAFCAFTPMSGFGCAQTVKEAGRVGEVKVTTVNYEPELLKLLEEGVIQQLVCQKRELFTWYGAQFLFDMVHDTNPLSVNDDVAGITNVPYAVNTGTFALTKENMSVFLEKPAAFLNFPDALLVYNKAYE
ncbi:ribose transport system substrate-binding protein [Catalinimonas alkaloidigena]|uniref:substrate-binding domain-containing protein n=1 Tax=Catalinimonas alkaloidigena TaxID=1075417 RepID=UPI002406D7E1|nr:substrate-binding domain-containing protein [Catalinimonas alkaloidigena]MDF9796555.1 ribose transport system substrate-binding protein [Catalinimonas alkaloidigena]